MSDHVSPKSSSHLATRKQRLAGQILEIVLFALTLGAGWFLWFLKTAENGQTPAKALLGMRVLDSKGQPVSWQRMLVRDIFLKVVAFILIDFLLLSMEVDGGLNLAFAGVVFWLFAGLWCTWDGKRQCLWDKPVGTHVEVA